MFIKAITSKPAYVEGRRFVDRTVKSRFKKGDISITTTYMDGKPILKRYTFEKDGMIEHTWKKVKAKCKNLDTMA